ncbi:hypothetical protein BCR34DRAFT_565496 [Clohesyomyces aquaticus]|uniref:Uncharacterized protein n=1 Tax=Clohesyomyces aquaticus TaxID=1231657 RepID=A0A1Y1ZM86_9PLEO|nr:hypothetical protein BCR34DRAFT_565496 [Clohesyomyces aquaticus]
MFVMLRISIQPVPPMVFVVSIASLMLAHLVSFGINSGLSSTVLQSIERLRSFSQIFQGPASPPAQSSLDVLPLADLDTSPLWTSCLC